MQRHLLAAGLLAGLALALLAYLAFAIGGLQGSMESLVRSLNSEPTKVENHIVEPTCTSKMKVINEVTHTQTYYQNPGESYEDYLVRMAREWELYCESL